MRLLRTALAAVVLCVPIIACAQTVHLPQVINAGGASVPATGSVPIDSSGNEKATNANPTVTIGKQESFQLVSANVPVISATATGGDYILSQVCSSYGSGGTLTLQLLGPDGLTWLPVASKTASDTGNGTGMTLASYATVRVVLSGTTGCYAILARVPN